MASISVAGGPWAAGLSSPWPLGVVKSEHPGGGRPAPHTALCAAASFPADRLCARLHSKAEAGRKQWTSSCQATVRCSASSASPATSSKIQDLKTRLEESLEKTDTNLTEESLAIVAELESLNPNPEPVLKPELWAGPFQMMNSSMQGVLYRGSHVTIGRATFNAFKPHELLIEMEEVYNDVKVNDPDAYNVLIPFTTVQQGLPPLKGVLFNEAKIAPSSATRLDVEFLGSTLLPRDSTVDLDAWLSVFGAENEMDDRGVCAVKLPPAKGWLEVTYLDEDLRITHGNFGTIVIVKRLPKPAIPVSV